MSAGFDRTRLPTWPDYAASEGLALVGRGKWRNVLCDFHDDTKPSMRVNVESGGWICMSCRTKGADVLDHYMQKHGISFVAAARVLGAIDDKGQPLRPQRRFSASDALGSISMELNVCTVVISDIKAGVIPNDVDWQRFLAAAGLVQAIADEARR